MKKRCILFLTVILSAFLFCACAEKEPAASEPAKTEQKNASPVVEVKITLENLYDYFEFREFKTPYKSDEGDVTSMQVSYGLALKDGYTAANTAAHKDTMEIAFTADGVVNSGEFQVDFSTLQYSGSVASTETQPVSGTLKFWPKGDRTVIWPFGFYSGSYAIYLENFTVTSAKGSIFLKNS